MATDTGDETGDDGDDDGPLDRTRPHYPFISLKEAIERVKLIYKKHDKGMFDDKDAIGAMGLAVNSGNSKKVVGALKRFGFMAKVRVGRFTVSPLALKIITLETDPRLEKQAERQAAIRQAALTPKLYNAVWNDYKGTMPADGALTSDLLSQHGMSQAGVPRFIKTFKETVAFADLANAGEVKATSSDGAGTVNPAPKDNILSAVQNVLPPVPSSVPSVSSKSPVVMRAWSFPLMDGKMASLTAPYPLTEEDYESVCEWLTFAKSRLVRKATGEKKEPESAT